MCLGFYKKFIISFLVLLLILNCLFIPNSLGAIKKDNVNDEIPSEFIPLYQKAAQKYGVSWFLLASVHNQETTFSSNVSKSSAGAIGHAQFMRCTWVGWSYSGCKGTKGDSKAVNDTVLKDPEIIKKNKGYGIDGNKDGKADPWDLVDAIYSMANYLRSGGSSKKGSSEKEIVLKAAKTYNHSDSYASEIYARYNRYKTQWKGESPADSVGFTFNVQDEMWSEGVSTGIDAVFNGSVSVSNNGEVGKIVSDGEGSFTFVSMFETRVIDADDIANVGVKDKRNYDNSIVEYLLTNGAKFLSTIIYTITVLLSVLLFGYVSFIWLLILLARRGIFILDNLLESISFGRVDAHDNLGGLIKTTVIVTFLVAFSISGYISDVFILIYSAILMMIDKI